MPSKRRSDKRRSGSIGARAPWWLLLVGILAAGAWSYSNSLAGVLAYDDIEAIAANPTVRTLALPTVLHPPLDTTVAGRPVVNLSFALNYAAAPAAVRDVWTPHEPGFADNIRGYRLTNIAIHLMAAMTLFGVIRRSLLTPRLRSSFEGSATGLSAAITVLWVVHPLHTASVTYLVQRAEALMGLFLLLTLYCAIRAVDAARPLGWGAAACAACALGMATKETMVVAPLIVGTWLLTIRRGDHGPERRDYRLLAGLAMTWVLLAWLVAGGARHASVGAGLDGWTPISYLRTQSEIIVHYLSQTFLPTSLVFLHDWPAAAWTSALPELLALTAALACGVWMAWRRRPIAFPILWFFLILAPTSSVLPIATEVAADHRMYLPVAAVIALVVLGGHRMARERARAIHIGVLAVVGLAAWFSSLTHARNLDYTSRERLMLDTVQKQPGNVRARISLGGELLERGAFADAERHLAMAIDAPEGKATRRSVRAAGLMYMGSAIAAQGRIGEAARYIEQAIALDPNLPEAYALLGEAYLDDGRVHDGLRMLNRAIESMPSNVPVLNRLAWLLATAPDDAIRDGTRALQLASAASAMTGHQDPIVLDTLAAALAETGRFAEAVATIDRAAMLAANAGNTAIAAELRTRIAVYQMGRSLRVPVGAR